MPTKIYSPKDFPKPKPDEFREELLQKFAAAIEAKQFERTENGIKVQFTNNHRYTKENLIDFSSYYALHGGWKSVTTSGLALDLVVNLEM